MALVCIGKEKAKKKKDKLKWRDMLARINSDSIRVSLYFTNFPLFLKVKNGFLKVNVYGYIFS